MLRTFTNRQFLNVLNTLHLCVKRNAGHSKWQNIKHDKGIKDAERSRLFTKLSRQIKVAVQEGGSADPSKNLKLEQIIEQTKRVNMPAATLQSVLKSCLNDKSAAKKYLLEIKGPGGCFILCEVYTTHVHMFKQNLSTLLKKNQAKFGDGGGNYLFEEKGIIEAELPPSHPDNKKEGNELLEIATEHAIESNSEEVTIGENNVMQFVCGETNLKSSVSGLEKIGYVILSASVEYIPVKTQTLAESDLKLYDILLGKLSDLPEVVRLFDNVENV